MTDDSQQSPRPDYLEVVDAKEAEHRDRIDSTRTLGMVLFLASLGVLFVASLVAYLFVRLANPGWGAAQPPLPAVLWASTVIILASSFTMQWALQAARGGQVKLSQQMLLATSALAFAFLFSQLLAWGDWVGQETGPTSKSLYSFTFYVLTGLHAAHALGGMIALGYVTIKAFRGGYDKFQTLGLAHCVMYWHFLDAVWVVLFVALKIGHR